MLKEIVAGVAGAYAAISGFFGYGPQPLVTPPPPALGASFVASTTLRSLSIQLGTTVASTTVRNVPQKKAPAVTPVQEKKKVAPIVEPTRKAAPPSHPPVVAQSPPVPTLSEAEKTARAYYWTNGGCGGIDKELFSLCAAYAFKHDSMVSLDSRKKASALSAIQAASEAKMSPGESVASNERALAIWNEYRPKLEAVYARILMLSTLMNEALEKQVWRLCADREPLPGTLAGNAYQKEVLNAVCTKAGALTGIGGWTYIDALLADVVLELSAQADALTVERNQKLQGV